MLEKHFQQKVITVAHYYGWLVQHTRAVNSDGRWMTPISGDPGFPDLCLVHLSKGLLFAELKSDRGKLSEHQVNWVAHYYGWLVQHTRAVNSDGRWMTPISGDAGFVDLVLVHPTRRGLIFAELKSDRGKVSPNQATWITALGEYAECHVWRPKDMHTIVHRLQGRKPT